MISCEWWINGFIPQSYDLLLTHRSARLTMANNRLFGRPSDSGDVWDLRDSVLELCEHEQRQETTLRSIAGLPSTIDFRSSFDEDRIFQWLSEDPGNGFIRIYPPDRNEFSRSCLVPCNLKTPVQQICRKLGIGIKVLHLQMNGDVIRRLEPQELPLSIQNDFLVSLGYSDIIRMQEEGSKEELAYLIKFYAGKPICEGGALSQSIQGYAQVRKGGMFQQWTIRWCAMYNTRIHFYKDETKKESPTIFQLMGGSVERTEGKGMDFCLKMTSRDNDKQMFMNFADENECLAWFKKTKKATDPLPTTADLSCCHLEYLPENAFINKDLMVLNLQHNLLKDRPSEEDATLGWIDDLEKFANLRSINLADNNLQQFPTSICKITTLVELNLASNKIKEVPSSVKLLENLQVLHLHNNHLTNLPDEIISLKKLSVLILAFNRFTTIPTVAAQLTNIRFSEVEGVIMAGNHVERIATDVLMELKHARKLDLRLNMLTLPLTETMKFSVLEHLSHLDVRDNQISELDLRSVKTLEILCCERNGMTSLSLHGGSLKVLLASCNCLDQLVIFPKPEGLVHIDISDNCLEYLPDWVSDCHHLKKLIAHENFLRELPPRLFVSARKLSHINLAHNHLTSLPSEIGDLSLESLQIQHNYIFALPQNLLRKLTRLNVFNSSRSLLQSLPSLHDNTDLNRLQELHLTGNFLGNNVMKVIVGYSRLKILSLAHNEISELFDEDIAKLEMLQEFNVSSNQLQSLPESLGRLPNLVVLRAHSNYLTSLPNFCQAKSLRILDVGHNRLLNISVTDLMASKLNLLDIGLNEKLKVDRQEFRNIVGKKNICLVDSSGQNRRLPGLTRKRFPNNLEFEDPSCCPWKVGFSESSGSRNKLCIQIVKFLDFNDNKDCLVGIFDGGRNSELPKVMAKVIKKIFQEEIGHPVTRDKFMKYAFLSAHRNLKVTGQKIGLSAALCHIHKTLANGGTSSGHVNGNKSNGRRFNFVLTIANVGDVEAVLCRKGEAVLLTRKFVALSDNEETQRVCKSNGIVTEDGKVNGITPCTRMLGCAHLYPHVIPDPFCVTLPLESDDEFIIVANSSFWKYVPYEEAVEEAYDIGNPVVASKHLQDLAECYGSKENIAVLVLRLNTEPGPSLGRLKPPHREMSVDDVEAAIQHDLEIAHKRSSQKKLMGGHYQTMNFVKNRQFYPQSLFPVSKTFNNNNNHIEAVTPPANINNHKLETVKALPLESKIQNVSGTLNNSPPQTKVVTFQSGGLNNSYSSQSQTSPSNSSCLSSSSKVAKNSYSELNSSSTTSRGSSMEGSVSFVHNNHLSRSQMYELHSTDSTQASSSSCHDSGSCNSTPSWSSLPGQSHESDAKIHPPLSPSVKPDEIFKTTTTHSKPPLAPSNSTVVEVSVHASVRDASPSPVRRDESTEEMDFPNHLRVDGSPHGRRNSKTKLPNVPSRPQSRFIKKSSALEALNSTSLSQQSQAFLSGDSLLYDSLSQLNPSDHLNKITSAKEKKLSMYIASNKTVASPGTNHHHHHHQQQQQQHVAKSPISPSEADESTQFSRNLKDEIKHPQPKIPNNDEVRDSEIIEIMTRKPPHPAPRVKRGSVINTIAMFESASPSKPTLRHDDEIPEDGQKSCRSPDGRSRNPDQEAPQNFEVPKATLNPAKYQLKSTARPLEIRTNTDKVNKPSAIIRSSYVANIGALPKSRFEFNLEKNNNFKREQDRSIKPYEIAKF